MSIDELIQAANQLNEPDLDKLFQQVLLLRSKHKAPILSTAETELLLQINQGVPADLHQQYQTLRTKSYNETLSEGEYQALLDLSDQIEIIAAERAGLLVKLAELRQVPLKELMEKLEIKAPNYA